jgi:hypothetical protein
VTRSEKMALVLVALSTVLYAGLLGVPFLSLELATKAALAGGLVAAGEGTFWLAAAIAGPRFVRRARSRLATGSWLRRSH